MTYKENPDRKVYNIDFDGTLTTGESYEELNPNHDIVQRTKQLYYSGHIIIIWSARQWSDASTIAGWLILHNIPFHGVMLGKGGTDFYVDDKNVLLENFLSGDK